MSKISRIYLHIGMPKTGSTSIQKFLSENRGRLQSRGYAYLKSLGAQNQMKLSFYVRDRLSRGRARMKIHSRKYGISKGMDVKSFRAEVERDLLSEIEGLKEGVQTLVFSCELLARIPFDSIYHLNDLFSKITDDCRIVLYLRSQVGYIQSCYSTSLRGQNKDTLEAHAFDRREAGYLQYNELIEAWGEVFGLDKMIVRLFDRDDLHEGDIVKDFARVIGLPMDGLSPASRAFNRSLDQRFQRSVLLMNEQFPKNITSSQSRALPVFFNVLAKEAYAGEPYTLRHEVCREIAEGFAETNEIVRRRWFPHKEELFKEVSATPRSRTEPEVLDCVERELAQDLLQDLLKRELRAIQGGRAKRPVL